MTVTPFVGRVLAASLPRESPRVQVPTTRLAHSHPADHHPRPRAARSVSSLSLSGARQIAAVCPHGAQDRRFHDHDQRRRRPAVVGDTTDALRGNADRPHWDLTDRVPRGCQVETRICPQTSRARIRPSRTEGRSPRCPARLADVPCRRLTNARTANQSLRPLELLLVVPAARNRLRRTNDCARVP